MRPVPLIVCALTIALLAGTVPRAAGRQALGVLRIKVVLIDPAQTPTPVPRLALLISENPASAAPRRTITGIDGIAEVRLRAGSYTIESDRPITFHGASYSWTRTVDVAGGRDTLLELTAANAEVETVATATDAAAASPASDPSFLLPQWRDSVVELWTPSAHGSGVVIDAKGLIATNQRIVGTATAVEVQLTPTVKVAARVLAADRGRDIAVLWIDPGVIASAKPVPLACPPAAPATVAAAQEVFAFSIGLRQPKGLTSGKVTRADADEIIADVLLARGSTGGPVFSTRGELVGITSLFDKDTTDTSLREEYRIVPSVEACEVVAAAGKQMQGAPPSGTPLPLEPALPVPVDALTRAVEGRAGSLNPYQISSSTFDIAFITPVLVYGAQYQADQVRRRNVERGGRTAGAEPAMVRRLMEFGYWTPYVQDVPPVLLVRVTPKLVEGFWTTVARGAARTQGVSIPPIKHLTSGFARLRAFCGETEITPIHPFVLDQRVSETDAIHEGLYAFDPGALGPPCGTVKLLLYAEKDPAKADTRVVEPAVIEQIWQDFAPYRTGKP